jgi:hypothetical protein
MFCCLWSSDSNKSDLSIQQYVLFVLQCVLPTLQIEELLDFLLYTKCVVTCMMPLLITVQLFVDGLHYVLMTATMLSHVIVVVTSNLLWTELIHVVVTLIQVVGASLIVDLM